MLAEKELQGRQPTRVKNSFTPYHLSTTPSTSRGPARTHFSMTPSTSRASSTSTGRTSNIKCHCCHEVGHFQRDCPSKKSYIITDDEGYVSASDVEDDFTL
jgi:hypothetical protein